MKNENEKSIKVLLIIGENSYTISILNILKSKYSYIGWILAAALSNRMICRYYTKGAKIWDMRLSYNFLRHRLIYWLIFPISISIQLFTPALLGILLSRKMNVRFDICIAEFYHGFLCALFMKKLGLVRKVVYYVPDWFPYQPRRKVGLVTAIANNIAFPYLDRFCASRADATWNFTQRIIDARHNRWENQPFSVPIEEVIYPPLKWRKMADTEEDNTNHKSIGFLGVLRKGQGLELAIETIADLKKKGIFLTLEIIGTSSSEKYYKDYVRKFRVEAQVIFHGFVEEEIKVAKVLQKCFCALALYDVGKDNYTYYTWPSKVGFYLECGIPVIITRSPTIADEIEKEKLGIIVKPDSDSISHAIYTLATDDNLLKEYKENIKRYVQSSSTGNEMNNAIMRLLINKSSL